MGKTADDEFVYGMVTESAMADVQILVDMRNGNYVPEEGEKINLGLNLLEEMTGKNVKYIHSHLKNGQTIGQEDLQLLNQAFSQIFADGESLNPGVDGITEDNWQEMAENLADLMAAYLESPKPEADIPPITVLAEHRYHPVTVTAGSSLEQKRWEAFNRRAAEAAEAQQPTIAEQIELLGNVLGEIKKTETTQELLTEMTALMYDEHGQLDVEKVDAFLKAGSDWLVNNIMEKGREVESVLPDMASFIEQDPFTGKVTTYKQEDGEEFNRAELVALNCVSRCGLSTIREDGFRMELWRPFGMIMAAHGLWKEYLGKKGLEVSEANSFRNYTIRAYNRKLEESKATMTPEERHTLMLGYHCMEGGYTKARLNDLEADYVDEYKENLDAATKAANAEASHQAVCRVAFTDPDKNRRFTANMNDLAELGEQFKMADHWYHKNSEEYKNLDKAMDGLRKAWLAIEMKGDRVRKAGQTFSLGAEEYDKINHWAGEVEYYATEYLKDKGKARGTGLGEDRYDMAMTILSKVSPDFYKQEEAYHNRVREDNHDSHRVSLKDLEEKVGKHADKNREKLTERMAEARIATAQAIEEERAKQNPRKK